MVETFQQSIEEDYMNSGMLKEYVFRIISWALLISLILSLNNVVFPKYGLVISFALGVIFMDQETKKYKGKWLIPLVSSILLSLIVAISTYVLTFKMCKIIAWFSLPTTYCVESFFSRAAKMESIVLFSPWTFILLMFIWYKVLFRQKYS